MQVSVDAVRQPGAVTLVIAGEIDQGNVAVLRAAVDEALATGPGRLRLDLSGVTFLDSMGVAALVAANKAGRAAGTPVEITAMHPAVESVLQVAALLPLFDAGPSPAPADEAG